MPSTFSRATSPEELRGQARRRLRRRRRRRARRRSCSAADAQRRRRASRAPGARSTRSTPSWPRLPHRPAGERAVQRRRRSLRREGCAHGALSTALAGRVAWDGVLRQISQVLPEDVWLDQPQASARRGASDRRLRGGRGRRRDRCSRFHVLAGAASRGCSSRLARRPDAHERAAAVEPAQPVGERRARPVHDPRRGASRPEDGLVKRKLAPAAPQRRSSPRACSSTRSSAGSCSSAPKRAEAAELTRRSRPPRRGRDRARAANAPGRRPADRASPTSSALAKAMPVRAGHAGHPARAGAASPRRRASSSSRSRPARHGRRDASSGPDRRSRSTATSTSSPTSSSGCARSSGAPRASSMRPGASSRSTASTSRSRCRASPISARA